jgi:thymidylate kinase
MIDTNLILIDGLPGSGKSANAQLLWLHLLGNGHDAQWFFEHQNSHPIYKLDDLVKAYDLALEECQRIHEAALSSWETLARSLRNTRRLVILESTFFQTMIGWLQLMNSDREDVLRYSAEVQRTIQELNPVLIYFYQADPAGALRRIRQQRGDWFEELLVSQIGKTPFGQVHGVRDFDGVIGFFVTVRGITDEIFSQCSFGKLAIDTSEGNWSNYCDGITDFLSVPRMDHGRPLPDNSPEFTGTYRDPQSEDLIVIAADQNGLYFDDSAKTRLVHKVDNTFCIQGMCVEFSFGNGNGRGEIKCTGDLPGLAKSWVKV